MELCFIYLFIGISTLALNLVVTLHMIRRHTGARREGSWNRDDIITFRLTREDRADDNTTAAASCDDTMLLE